MNVHQPVTSALLTLALAACLGCAQSTSTGTHTLPPTTGNLTLAVTAGSTEDWQQIGVTVLGLSLTPQGGGPDLKVFVPPTPGLQLNLATLNHVSKLLGNVPVPVGTYTAATLTLAAGSDYATRIALASSNAPSPEFPGTRGLTDYGKTLLVMNLPSGAKVLDLVVPLTRPLSITADQGQALDLAFDLARPTFLVPMVPPPSSLQEVRWAMDFDHVLAQAPLTSATKLVLQHLTGYVDAVSADRTTLSFKEVFGGYSLTDMTLPQSLRLKADATVGFRHYDLAAQTEAVLTDFSTLAGTLVGTPLRIAARLQEDGSLTLVRLWTGSQSGAPGGWELDGQLAGVNLADNTLFMLGAADGMLGGGYFQVDDQTRFFLRNPSDPKAEVTPIGTGTAFLQAGHLLRGFKVHTTSRWLNKAPYWLCQSVDLEAPMVEGLLSGVAGAFTITRANPGLGMGYAVTLPPVVNAFPDPTLNPASATTGFKWWDLAEPGILHTGNPAAQDLQARLATGVDFGGTVGVLHPWTSSQAVWGTAANPGGWSLQWTESQGLRLPVGTVASPWVASAQGGSFTMTVPGGTQAVVVDVSTAAGSVTRFYAVQTFGSGPLDLATQLAQATRLLVPGTSVRVYGAALANGHIQAQAISHLTPW
jgi:hypothetical protein